MRVRPTDILGSVAETSSWAVTLYGLVFLIGVGLSVLGVGVHPLVGVGAALLLLFAGLAWQSYRETLDN